MKIKPTDIDGLDGTEVANTPAGSISATTVQAAINELDTEKQPISSNLTSYAGGDTPSAFTLGIVDSVDAAAWRTAIGAGTSTVTPSALTKTDDTNITMTLGGTPATALLEATSLTLGWTGTLAVARGGTGASTEAGARTNLGLDAGGAGDIWVEKAGDTMSSSLLINNGSVLSGAYPIPGTTGFQIASNSNAGLFGFAPTTLFNAYSFTGGDVNSPGALASGNTIFRFVGGGWDSSAIAAGAQFTFQASENWSTTAHGMRIVFITTTNGTTSNVERLRIADNGDIQMGGANTVINASRHHQLRSYTVAGLPSAATAGQMIYVSNETGGAVPAFSDGANWRRVTDRAIVS